MIRGVLQHILQFITLVLVQVFILNNIQFSGFINPFLYILFILWLPVDLPKWTVMILAFLIGISVDVFTDTLGMHTSAAIFLAYCRPKILSFLAPRDGYEVNQKPGIRQLGFGWFLIYSSVATVLHHLFLFFVEVFRFEDFLSTIGRSLASSAFTILLILLTQFFFYKGDKLKD